MANLTRFNPFSELAQFDPFDESFFKNFSLRPVFWQAEGNPKMRLDVSEDDKAYTVKADIPGVDKKDIRVSVDGNQVLISAEIKKEKEEKKDEKVIRSERYYGSVSRSFSLAQDVDEGGAEARYDKGVLVLTLPKKAGGNARQLTVS